MDRLDKCPDETDLAYHKRLIYGKLVDGTLQDVDYTELAPYVYGKEYSSDVARRMMYGSRKTLDLLGEQAEHGITSDDLLSELDAKKIEYQKERQKCFDQRAALNKLIRGRSRQEELNEILCEAIKTGNLPVLNHEHAEVEASDNDLLVSLNDIHYGADIDNYWNKYNSAICWQMIETYLNKVLAIAETHHSENCIVWANGDQIHGNIHYSIAVTNKENVIEQVKGVSELISQFLAALSNHFNKVTFVSVAGNHSRLNPDKDKALFTERLDDLVEWYLEARLQDIKNIVIGGGQKIDETMYLIDIRGKTYCGVHGDYEQGANKIQTLQTMAQKPVYAVLTGHLHHCKIDEVQGVKTIMSGSFLGMDDYCVQKRIYGQAEQMVCVCDEHGIRCSYSVPLHT